MIRYLRMHGGRDFEIHVIRFHIFDEVVLSGKCIIHDAPLEFRAESALNVPIAREKGYSQC